MTENGHVMTVLGPIDSADLGHTLPHEHVLSDLSRGPSAFEKC